MRFPDGSPFAAEIAFGKAGHVQFFPLMFHSEHTPNMNFELLQARVGIASLLKWVSDKEEKALFIELEHAISVHRRRECKLSLKILSALSFDSSLLRAAGNYCWKLLITSPIVVVDVS